MNFLAIDTSNDYLCVMAVKDGEVVTAFTPDCAMKHSVSLMTAVDDVLQRANLALNECDFFAVAVGAGSFTGIRIGISAVKGFALATGKKVLPITSFDVIAYNNFESAKGKVLCLINALQDCYYVCGYEQGEVVYPPAYLTETEVLNLAASGYALLSCSELPIAQKAQVRVFSPVVGLEKAVRALAEKDAFGEPTALYVRKSSAEINLCK